MAALFADIPEAIDNTVEIARRCSYYPKTRSPILPRFAARDAADSDAGVKAEADELARQARDGLTERLASRGLTPGFTRGELPRSAGVRALGHREDEISRLFPDRRGLHQMGEGAGHSGRSRPRLRRRLAGRLCHDHHRCRPAALLAAVRALPQSRPRVDARLRHRLLPGPPRRGDPLRPGEIRPRPGRPDHHLRNAAGARRAARRRPRAADALQPGRPADQDGAVRTRPIR